jgi:hypothetical protein
MQADSCTRRCSLVATTVAVLASVVGVAAGLLGVVPAGAVVLGEFCALACVGAFTLLIWAAIEDGRRFEVRTAV